MWKKILIGLLIAVLTAVLCFYFYFCHKLDKEQRQKEVCTEIKVCILDSLTNKFLTPKDITNLLTEGSTNPINKKINAIDLNSLEILLSQKSAVKKSDISIRRNGLLRADITQRRPVLRIQTNEGGFYIDDEKYIFPLVSSFTSYVPIVSGYIPIKLQIGHRGSVRKKEEQWLDKLINFGEYLDQHPFWNKMIQEIYIKENLDVLLFTRIGDQTINFGKFTNFDEKFSKLDSFYHNVVPVYGWDKYKEVNLKFDKQIVCKKK
ncbi:MAG: hypothetical protein WC140_07100 [Bacteroidales bacterium]